jgi:hypothetical protein
MKTEQQIQLVIDVLQATIKPHHHPKMVLAAGVVTDFARWVIDQPNHFDATFMAAMEAARTETPQPKEQNAPDDATDKDRAAS